MLKKHLHTHLLHHMFHSQQFFFISLTTVKSYFIMNDLYRKFNDKFKFANLLIKQHRLTFVFFHNKNFRQTKIIIYFKFSSMTLISNKQYVNFTIWFESNWIDYLIFNFDICRFCFCEFFFWILRSQKLYKKITISLHV